MSELSGPNYDIELTEDGLAIARLRRRPDIDTSAGADAVESMATAILDAADERIAALLLDLTEAPAVTGPRTQATLTSLLGHWCGTGRRAAVVVGDSAVQRMQVDRIAAGVRTGVVIVATSAEAAVHWLRGSLPT
ncbi:MAG TPA: hypothetical protein VG755_07575 [Nannocystaceae bacterium]|nr:hypothetical protein [Nannocystaceae bacterium]